MCDAVKAVLKRKIVVLNAYIAKEELLCTNNLSFYLSKLEKEGHIKSKVWTRKEIRKIEINFSNQIWKEEINRESQQNKRLVFWKDE